MTKRNTQKYDFKNSKGETLSGRLEMPAEPPRAFALFAHAFTTSKNILASTRIARALSENGIAVLRFDFTGLGDSEGDFAETNFSSNVDDLRSAYHALEKDFEAPQILIGHSLGGAAVLKISPDLEAVKAVVTVGAPSDVSHVSHHFADSMNEIEKEGKASVDLYGRVFTIKKQFITDITGHSILDGLSKSKKAYLIFHSPLDNTVSVKHAGRIYEALSHPKSFVSLDDADHLVTRPHDARFIAEVVSSWV